MKSWKYLLKEQFETTQRARGYSILIFHIFSHTVENRTTAADKALSR